MTEQKEESNSYLTFKVGEEEFGAHVSQILNILEMTKITDVPKTIPKIHHKKVMVLI